MSINKAYQMWMTGGVSMDILKKILFIVPLAEKTCLNFNEFKVIFHLIYKSLQYEIPSVLPNSLKIVLYPEPEMGKINPVSTKDINFGDKFGLDYNLSKQKERKENVIETNPNTLQFNSLNHMQNTTLINTNKSVDMESLLMSEFNLRNNQNNNISNINLQNMHQNSTLNLTNEKSVPPRDFNNIQTINNLSNNVTDKFTNIYNDKLADNKFLEQTLEEETRLLNKLRDEVEKVHLNISQVNQRNSQIKNQILEIRRQIELEKNNLSKGLSEFNQITNEMMRSQGK